MLIRPSPWMSFHRLRSNLIWARRCPAEVQAFIQASIHARASGYLKNWFVDIGDHVTNNQVLAEIETPEVDQQLAQARAELDQSFANLGLAKISADRWTELLKSSSVSEQETAEKQADYTLKQANVAAAQANVRRLEETEKLQPRGRPVRWHHHCAQHRHRPAHQRHRRS